ncbi:MAG: hypothetical protein ACI30H_05030 [Paludibacteraceae bacterium]
MSNKKENEELQSRREFFKQAAKAALPVVGAVVAANLPIIDAKAMTGCNNWCSGCTGSCTGPCTGQCASSCSGGCQGGCKGYY